MRAAVFDKTLSVMDVPLPEPREGEALIKVLAAGVCNTDLEILQGYMNFSGIPGHEFVGIVEFSTNEHLIGKRVVGEINCVCHQCTCCRNNMENHCENRTVLGIKGRPGVFAEYVVIPEENLHLVPETITDEMAIFTEPLAAAFRVLEQVTIENDTRIIVLGDGKLGQLLAQTLWLRSNQVLCVGKHPEKLKILNALGIPTVLVENMRECGADVVIDATGSQDGLPLALKLVRPQGTIILKTTLANTTAIDWSIPVINEIHLLGSRCGPFKPALEALTLGTVDVVPLISKVYSLDEIQEAMAQAVLPQTMKVIIRP